MSEMVEFENKSKNNSTSIICFRVVVGMNHPHKGMSWFRSHHLPSEEKQMRWMKFKSSSA